MLYWPAFQDAYKSKSRRACSSVSSQWWTTPHPSEHNLNYTIWTLYAESVSFPITCHFPLGRAQWNQSNNSARAQWNQSSRFGAHSVKSIKQFWARSVNSVKQIGARSHSCQRTMSPELRVNRRIAQPPSPTECEPSCQRPIHLPLNVNLPAKDQSTSH